MHHRRLWHAHAVVLALFALGGCAGTGQPRTAAASPTTQPTPTATPLPTAAISTFSSALANLTSASGSLVSGQLTLVPTNGGVRVTGTIGGLKPNGVYAFHLYETGDCSAVDASSAGDRFNPGGQSARNTHLQHSAAGQHNLVANHEGVATVDTPFTGVVLGGGSAADIVNRAFVVLAGLTSQTSQNSQPAGPAEQRIACGVIQSGRRG